MSSTADIVAAVLAANWPAASTLTPAFGTNIFVGRLPDEPDEALMVETMPGGGPWHGVYVVAHPSGGPPRIEETFGGGGNYMWGNYRVWVRSAAYDTGYALAADVQASMPVGSYELSAGKTVTDLRLADDAVTTDRDPRDRVILHIAGRALYPLGLEL